MQRFPIPDPQGHQVVLEKFSSSCANYATHTGNQAEFPAKRPIGKVPRTSCARNTCFGKTSCDGKTEPETPPEPTEDERRRSPVDGR